MEEAIYFKEKDNVLFIKAIGHVTASLCTDLKCLVNKRMEIKPYLKEIIIDLSFCEYMDSTFMGLLIGFNKILQKKVHKTLEIYRPTQACKRLFSNLGINKILKTIDEELNLPHDMKTISKTAAITAELLFKAHENLMELSVANRQKFALLQCMLKKELEKKKRDAS